MAATRLATRNMFRLIGFSDEASVTLVDDEGLNDSVIVLATVTGDVKALETSALSNFEPHFKADNVMVLSSCARLLELAYGGFMQRVFSVPRMGGRRGAVSTRMCLADLP